MISKPLGVVKSKCLVHSMQKNAFAIDTVFINPVMNTVGSCSITALKLKNKIHGTRTKKQKLLLHFLCTFLLGTEINLNSSVTRKRQ